MTPTSELVRASFKKHRATILFFGIVFGLNGRDFISQLWSTGDIGTAWSYWISELWEVPITLLLVAVPYALAIAWDVHAAREADDLDARRPDGYRAQTND